MLSLGAAMTGFVMDLADDTKFGLQYELGPTGYTKYSSLKEYGTPSVTAATLQATCNGKEPMTTRFWNMEQDSRQVQDVIMEIINMPSNCVNRHQHLEPCVPHNTLHMSPQNVPEAPSYFQCRYDGAKSSITVDAPAPFIEWVYIDKIRVDHLVKANCTLPTIEQLMTIADYNFQDGFLSVDVTLVHRVNGTGSMDIPFGGVPGGNILKLVELLMPPMAPSPPVSPPAPADPWGMYNPSDTAPGWLYRKHGKMLEAFGGGTSQFYQFQRFQNLCWSSARGDSWSSNVWHSKCNNKGKTLWFAREVYSSKEYVAGSYQRDNWAGSGYANDGYSRIFTFNQHHMKTGSQTAGWWTKPTSNGIYRNNGYGPTYGGGHDWHVSSNMRTGYMNFGNSYKCRIGNYGQNACQADILGSYSSWSINEAEMWSEKA